MKILITGACGVTGRSVTRSLKMSDKFKRSTIIGADVCYNLYGVYEGLYEKMYKIPWCKDKNYRSSMKELIKKERIDVAIILPELEVVYWAENSFDVKYLKTPAKFSRLVLSKKRLCKTLSGTGLVPNYQIVSRRSLEQDISNVRLDFPLWIRDYAEGTTSGKGSFSPSSYKELQAWLDISKSTKNFLLSEYLPGKNFGCFLLYYNGELLKAGVAERTKYFMSEISVSGVTGNASEGRLVNNQEVISRSTKAIDEIVRQTRELINGLFVVDLKEDSSGNSFITEINIKHAAITSIFASAGFNLSEYQLLCALGKRNELTKEIEMKYPKNNLFLRDIDGDPVYLKNFRELKIGEAR